MQKGTKVLASRNIYVWEFFGGKPEDFIGKSPEQFENGMLNYDIETGVAVPMGTKGTVSTNSSNPIDDIMWSNQSISLALYGGYTTYEGLEHDPQPS